MAEGAGLYGALDIGQSDIKFAVLGWASRKAFSWRSHLSEN
ncbi:MAG: hypothetical protein ABL911_10405 [Gallionella sp.]